MSNEEIISKVLSERLEHVKNETFPNADVSYRNIESCMDAARSDERQRIISDAGLPDIKDVQSFLKENNFNLKDAGDILSMMLGWTKIIRDKAAALIAKEREESLRFAEWIAHNGYIRLSNDLWYKNSNGAPNDGLATAQLRELYEKSK